MTMSGVIPDGNSRTSYTIELTVRQWQIIDGTMDNAVAVASQNGDPRAIVDLGSSVRAAGWEQVGRRDSDVPGSGGWPPNEQVATVTMSGEQWALVSSSLAHWAEISEELGDVDDASTSRAIRDIIVHRLSQQTPGSTET